MDSRSLGLFAERVRRWNPLSPQRTRGKNRNRKPKPKTSTENLKTENELKSGKSPSNEQTNKKNQHIPTDPKKHRRNIKNAEQQVFHQQNQQTANKTTMSTK